MTRQLSSFPFLRLQDLNYHDIESFVHGELKLFEDVCGEPRQFFEMIHDVSKRAEGIFLWATLVCKSLVSGYGSKDSPSMIRQRLETMPAGLEALFALMFSNIDREHREHLSRCFFLLKWSRETDRRGITDISVPVITAFLSASPHQSLSDFVLDCRVVEHRVVAQAKGLLETCQPRPSMFDANDRILTRLGLGILSDTTSDHVGYRSVSPETDLTETYRTACIGWVHRSAYDYVLGDHSDYASTWQICVDEPEFLLRLLNAQSWLAHYFPGQHMDFYYAPVARLVSIFDRSLGELKVAGFEALDKLYETIEVSYLGGGYVGSDGSPVTGATLSLFLEGNEPIRAFWIILVRYSQGDYVITRFDRIRSSAYVDMICSGMIRYFWFWDAWNYIDASQVECMMPAMTLSFDHLFDQGPLGCAAFAARTITVSRDTVNILCISWSGRGRSTERVMVADILTALTAPWDFHPPSNYNAKRHQETDQSLRDFGQKLIALSKLWQIYCGRRFDLSTSTPLHLHVSAQAYKWNYERHLDLADRDSSDSAFPIWRFVCLGHNEDRARQWSSGEQVPVVTYFGVTAQKSRQLLHQFGKVLCTNVIAHTTLIGTSEQEGLCLETILEEVWADADGQFNDGWQQLYMLACLKKYFGALWNNLPADDLN